MNAICRNAPPLPKRRFLESFGWDQGLKSYVEKNFTFVNGPREDKGISLRADIRYGRLGNTYASIKNALLFAVHSRLSHLYLKKGEDILYFEGRYISEWDYENARPPFMTPCMESPSENVRGFFFFFPYERILENDASILHKVGALLKKSVRFSISNIDIPENVLVIHIRAGDIFSENGAGAVYYVQPPLAWYQKCILLHKKKYKNISIILVFEDLGNPCIQGVAEFCRAMHIPIHLQSGTLSEDYSYIMNASALIDSQGSFTYPAKDLSDSLKVLYHFSAQNYAQGDYIDQGTWKNTEQQRREMLYFPLERVIIPENFHETSRYQAPFSKESLQNNTNIPYLSYRPSDRAP